MGIYKVENRIYWIDPKVIDAATGRAVGADNLTNSAGFAGQVFFNPEAGGVGNLPSLGFDGPSQFRIDMALSKRFRFLRPLRDRVQRRGVQPDQHAELQPSEQPRQDINSTTFGRLNTVNVASRVIQISARFDF